MLHGSNGIYNMDYSRAVDFHINEAADITLLYKSLKPQELSKPSHYGILQIDNKRIISIEEKPFTPKTTKVSMGIYIISRKLLITLLEDSIVKREYDWVKGILMKKINEQKVIGYEYNGYWRPIHTILDYYQVNNNMLDIHTRYQLFYGSGPIYTKVKDEVPTKYIGRGGAENSIIADGTVIRGEVENSILFRGVYVGEGAKIKNSIIMQNTVIHEGVELTHVILDKEVRINRNKRLMGQENYPLVIPKKVVI